MPLTKLSTSMLWSSSFTKPTREVNDAIDNYNAKPNLTTLAEVTKKVGAVPRGHWKDQFQEINRLESEIKREFAGFKGNAAGDSPFGPKAKVDKSPTRWIKTLFPDAPSLEGLEAEGQGRSGAQGSTFKFTVGNRKLIAKTARSKDKNSVETETAREFKIYEQLYKTAGEHPNMVKVWGWADLKIGNQHEEGFIMDLIEGQSGHVAQRLLKEAWDVGMISSAEYWSCIQYIGRVHLGVLAYLARAGLAHNDIKPENYVVDSRTGEVIVIDLGGAAGLGANPQAVTTEYAAPELLKNGQPDLRNVAGTTRSDIFSIGATLLHATDGPGAHHAVARPNRGILMKDKPIELEDGTLQQQAAFSTHDSLGRVKNPFEYGVETDFTRQLKRMMNADPLERDKVVDEHASNRFLNDSILNDHDIREVLKGIVSGSRQREWDLKWLRAPAEKQKLKPKPGRNRLVVEDELKSMFRPYMGKHTNRRADDVDPASPGVQQVIVQKRQELKKMAELVQEANAFRIDTQDYQVVVMKKTNFLDLLEKRVAQAEGKKK